MASVTAPKGTKDVLPEESYKWQYLEGVLRRTAAEFGFREIRFPTFEHTELFLRGVGDTTDVVQKEMYTFNDKGGRSISLRPEGTASTVRSLIENSVFAAGLPVKCFYIAPNFRYEKPQAGRLREHHQFGVEMFGSPSPSADAEIISLADTFLRRLGLNEIELHINSIGCPNCRPKYYDALREYLKPHAAELCETCQGRLEKNPMRVLDCKSPICKEIAAGAPKAIEHLCDDCREHFDSLRRQLDDWGIKYSIDTSIVRGLDYYTNTVFEFISNGIGAQGTVCGGGRYNGLVGSLGGPEMPALGFGSGLERLLLAMEGAGVEIPKPHTTKLFIAAADAEASEKIGKIVLDLRRAGISAERDTLGRSLKAQMKYADRIGAEYSVVLGGNELAAGVAKVKNMSDGESFECEISAEALAAVVSK